MTFDFVKTTVRLKRGKTRKALLVTLVVFVSLSVVGSAQARIITEGGVSLDTGSSVRKYAVVVGISDYKAINDLHFCDEDATDWFNHLNKTMNFNSIWVYGDINFVDYPKYDGIATEYNVKRALQDMVRIADCDDIIVFISSGHGSGNGKGSAYLCMWDAVAGEKGEDGCLYDTELADILEKAVANKIFVFVDHCLSGGFGDDLMAMPNRDSLYITTTCTAKGYGYDDPEYENGEWTYFFLEHSWMNHYEACPTIAMERVFIYALANYPYEGEDRPQQYDGCIELDFHL